MIANTFHCPNCSAPLSKGRETTPLSCPHCRVQIKMTPAENSIEIPVDLNLRENDRQANHKYTFIEPDNPAPAAGVRERSSESAGETTPLALDDIFKSNKTTQLEKFGRYQIQGQLGRGGMGIVYKAYDPKLRRTVALKVLLGQDPSDVQVQRFFREAQAMGALVHPNIVAVYDIGTEQGQHFFAMEHIAGTSLAEYRVHNHLSYRDIATLMIKIGNALAYSHCQGVLHRDLKPSNIMITADGEPKIMDFGLARLTQASRQLSQQGMVMGTLQYMPPEQADGNIDAIDQRSDVYAMGAVLYELLTGKPPFDGETMFQIVLKIIHDTPNFDDQAAQAVPQPLRQICLKAIAKNKTDRYPNAEAFVQALQQWRDSDNLPALPASPAKQPPTFKWRWAMLTVAAVIIIAALALAFRYATSQPNRDGKPIATVPIKPKDKTGKVNPAATSSSAPDTVAVTEHKPKPPEVTADKKAKPNHGESKRSRTVAWWPMDEGQGRVAYNRIDRNRHRGFFGKTGKYSLKWTPDGLFFPGIEHQTYLEIEQGGQILSGKLFEIELEVRPATDKANGHLLTNSHSSSPGGFCLLYSRVWLGPHISLYLRDGTTSGHYFRAYLARPLSTEKWNKITISYNRRDLHFSVSANRVTEIYHEIENSQGKKTSTLTGDTVLNIDLCLKPSELQFLVGSYSWQSGSECFQGYIRNLALRVPAPAANLPLPDKQPKHSPAPKAEKYSANRQSADPILVPRSDPLLVGNNVVVPNWFCWKLPDKEWQSLRPECYLDVPDDLQLSAVGESKLGTNVFRATRIDEIQHHGRNYRRWKIVPLRLQSHNGLWLGPVYFESRQADGHRTAIYYRSCWADGQSACKKLPVQVRRFPEPGRPQKLHSSLGWMWVYQTANWPKFFGNYGKLGFNSVPTHGLYDIVAHRNDDGSLHHQYRDFIRRARQEKYRLVYVDSPYHSILAPTTRCSDGNGQTWPTLCPSYRGPKFIAEMSRVSALAHQLRPDWAFFDIECFDGKYAECHQCVRCNRYLQQNHRNTVDCGSELVLALKRAMVGDLHPMSSQQIAGVLRTVFTDGFQGDAPPIGVYQTYPGNKYCELFSYEHIHDRKGVDLAMPAYYSLPHPKIGPHMRQLRRSRCGGDIIPWLNPGGTIGSYPATETFDLVLECFGSGLHGLSWFAFDATPGDFYYYFAAAMQAIIPVEEVIITGRPLDDLSFADFTGQVTALVTDRPEYLVLVADYRNSQKKQVVIRLPRPVTGELYDLCRRRSLGKIIGNRVTINYSPGIAGAHTALYYIGDRLVKK